ncbi:MAG: hypothetical protein EPN75_11545 [Beijerinckiaceae bacterium]|nr:MAG: hypothetical protein EPN75_11545 [Beijerinckiaceae bacterium]
MGSNGDNGSVVRLRNAGTALANRLAALRLARLSIGFFLSLGLCILALTAAPVPASAAGGGCHILSEAGSQYVVCSFDMRQNRNPEEMRLFFAGPGGKPLGGFATLAAILKQRGEILLFAMNAGMFQENLRPVGLFIQAHKQIHPINLRGGGGNFHLKPNGVFYFGGHSAGVMETSAFVKSGLKPEYATQSGPMLVLDGKIHPKILPSGTSEKIRNGVGVRDGHIVIFAISEDPVTFYRFATLFRDRLGCPNALYLDGSVSSLYAPSMGREDGLRPLGPMVGIVEKVQDLSRGH